MVKRTSKQSQAEAGPRPGSRPAPSSVKPPASLLHAGNPTVICLLLFVIVLWTFWPSTRNAFVNLDDNVYVYENAHVQAGLTLDNLRWAFTNLEAGFWHPLTWLTIMLDCQLYGLRPAGHHLTSLLLHAASTVALFLAFRRMTGAPWRSAVVAALFALHPLHVEPVAWAADRKDVLCALFWMLALLMYARYVEGRRTNADPRTQRATAGFYLLSLFFFVCGLMSKTMIVTLPLLLLLLDWWPLQRLQLNLQAITFKSLRPLLLEKLPFLAAAFACGLLTLRAEKGIGALPTAFDAPIPSRVANALLSCLRYLGQTVWPADLTVYYPFPRSLPAGPIALAVLLLLLISAYAIWGARRRPWVALGWLWYLLTLLPVIGLIQVGSHAHADRYTYVPLIGVFAAIAWEAHHFTRHWRHQTLILSLAGGVVVLLCVALTRQQIGYWKDSEALFQHALAVTRDNELAHNNLGTALARQGRPDEAVAHLQEARRLTPDYPGIHNNLGAALARQGRLDEAIPLLREAIRLAPDDPGAHCNLADALAWKGLLEEAIAEYRAAIKLNSTDAAAHSNLADALARKGLFDDAIAQYQDALKLKPDSADLHTRLGTLLGVRNRIEEATAQFHEALRLDPNNAEAHCSLGIALVRQNRPGEAVPLLQEAVKLNPGYAEAHCNLGVALAQSGRLEQAIPHLQEALRLRPDYTDAQNNLRAALDLKAAADAASTASPKP